MKVRWSIDVELILENNGKGITVKTAETDITVYQETDIIECPDCLKALKFSELISKRGHVYPNNTCERWQEIHYHCCNNQRALVYDPGDGTPKRLVRGKLIKQ